MTLIYVDSSRLFIIGTIVSFPHHKSGKIIGFLKKMKAPAVNIIKRAEIGYKKKYHGLIYPKYNCKL